MRPFGPLLTLLLLLLVPAASGSTVEFPVESLEQPLVADGVWRFREGDDMRWADPELNHDRWDNIMAPRDWRRQGYGNYHGMGWYRATFEFDLTNPALVRDLASLGISVGKIYSAYELYINGEFMGGVGSLPPRGEVVHDAIRIYGIPRTLIGEDGRMTVAIRVWRDATMGRTSVSGMYEGPVKVGTVFDLTQSVWLKQVINLLLAVIYLVFGAYHLYLFLRNPRSREFFWFGLATVMVGVYTLEISQWKHLIPTFSYEVHKRIEYVTIYLLPLVGLEVVWSLLSYKPRRVQRIYQSLFVILALLVLLVPGHEIRVYTLFPWQVYTLAGLMGIMVQVMWEALHGNREARLMFFGWAIFLAAATNDILVAQGLLHTPLSMTLGFAAVLMTMGLSLANRITRLLNHLDREVRERTRELEETNRRLVESASLDPLTGLLNRRGFTQEIEAEISRARRTRRSFVLMMADVDYFKTFNDQHGHACGDYVLQEVAKLLKQQLRDVDVVARWGGEEFVFLLPETGLDGGAVLAEKVRAAVEAHRYNYRDNVMLSLTVTIGVAQYHDGMTLDECLHRADHALYQGKETGRNRVVVEVTVPSAVRERKAQRERELSAGIINPK